MIKAYRFFIYCFLCILSWNNVNAQYEKIIDSLKKQSPNDRKRIFFGYLESRSDILSKKDERAIFLKQVTDFAKQEKDLDLLIEIEFVKKKDKIISGNTREEREKTLSQYIEKNKNTEDLLFLGNCYHELGQFQFQSEKYGQAFESDLKALEIFEQLGYENIPNIGKILHEIALHYYFFRDYEEVIRLMRISLRFKPFSKGLGMQRYNNLGVSYMRLNKKDSAKFFFNEGIKVSRNYNSTIWEGILSRNLADLYYDENQYDSAFYYYKKNYNYNHTEQIHSPVKMNSYINMAKIYLALDSLKQAKKFLTLSQSMLSELQEKYIGDRQQIENSKFLYFQTIIKYLKKIGDYKTTMLYQDSLKELQINLDAKYNSIVAKMSADKINIQQKELKLAQIQKEKALQNTIYVSLISGFLILSGFGYFQLYKSKQRKKRQNERLIAQNRISILEKRQTLKELEAAQKEIDHFISKINEHYKIINQLENELVQLKNLESDQKKQVNETLQNLKAVKILTDEDWFEFQRNFEAVFPEFTQSIKSYSPTITSSEMRYLMLVKLGLNNKEMSRALGVTDAAIRVTWSRVRKKLNGTTEDTPQELIKKILQAKKELNLT